VSVTIEVARHASEELLAGLNRLLPQLSSSAPPLTMGDLEGLVSSPAVVLFVATDDGEVVGTLTLVVFAIPTGLRAWIEDVVVDEAMRGLGVGAALTTAATDEARVRGVRSVDLTSRPSREAANAMYQKLGFALRETNVYRFFLGNFNTDESQ
jgi:ribosomal protein S18 acetylase RimI-like enzyme